MKYKNVLHSTIKSTILPIRQLKKNVCFYLLECMKHFISLIFF